ncbi:F-box/kelch-repeat protein At3g06240 [Lathyrus oleraceus]|uniref:F-box/kelch-repeat protein At3g06240 n=1 Tax=Pisum sativum TaxID=3888 RepID=UPI0021D2DBDC|nr:F-box/kelch-repeat protein At3g06240-like [Pisum sativum]
MDWNMNKHKHVSVVAGTNEKVKLRKELHIHDDVAISILLKLCIKSLRRFECVCKSWSLLLDNPNFMTLYRNVFLTKEHPYYDHTSLLLHGMFTPSKAFELYSVAGDRFENKVKLEWPRVKYDQPISVYTLLKQNEYNCVPNFNILGSCSVNGILCLIPPFRPKTVVLWNPSINDFKVISPSFVNDNHSFHMHRGFGYDRHTDDYKVIYEVMCYRQIFGMKDLWKIYSLRTNSWRILDLNMHHKFMDVQQLYMDGLSHWMCKSETHDGTYLLSFDWSNEVFITTSVPSDIDDNFVPSVRKHFMLLKGSIALILNFEEKATFHISVLGEVSVKESWTKMFIIGPIPCLMYPIGEGKKGDMMFVKEDGGLVLFNLNTQAIEEGLGIKTNRLFHCTILIHRENLIPFEGKGI